MLDASIASIANVAVDDDVGPVDWGEDGDDEAMPLADDYLGAPPLPNTFILLGACQHEVEIQIILMRETSTRAQIFHVAGRVKINKNNQTSLKLRRSERFRFLPKERPSPTTIIVRVSQKPA